ncbi:MAG: S41 family peptidase, partial [Thermoguttaceae bacterium]
PHVSRSHRVLGFAMRYIQSRYLTPVEDRALFEGAMSGMTSALDEYSTYIPPAVLNDFNEQIDRQFGGIGIEIRINSETKDLTVASPLTGTPAGKAGILAGDRILRIDDKSTHGLSIEDAAGLLRGLPGEPVSLTLSGKGEQATHDVKLVREVIHIATVLGDTRNADGSWNYFLADHPAIAHLRLDSFGDQTGSEMRDKVVSLMDRGMKGLILDMRGNPGGLLPAAIDVCDLFIDPDAPPSRGPHGEQVPPGLIVTTRDRQGRVQDEYYARHDGTVNGFPIAVLIDGNSASAAEIVAACLQDHGKSVVIGERSFGKGTVQEILDLHPDEGLLKLTMASYWRPSGRNINRSEGVAEWGVSPNEGFEIKLDDKERGNLQVARRLRDVAASYTSEELAREEVPEFNDRQLDAAIRWVESQSGAR